MPNPSDIKSNIFFAGSEYVRNNVIKYLQYIFSTVADYKAEFEWIGDIETGEEDKQTKIHIASEYPDVPNMYPFIRVSSSGYTYEPIGFGQHIGKNNDREIAYEFGGRNTFDKITIRSEDHTQSKAEGLAGLIVVSFAHQVMQNYFISQTNIFPDITRIRVSEAISTPSKIQNTDKNVWGVEVSFPAKIEWMSTINFATVETIAGEIVADTKE